MALWTMTPEGEHVLVVSAHRAHAAAMTENDPLTAGESERLLAALREKDRDMGHPVHYGPRKAPLCGEEPVGTYWADEPESVVGCDDCLAWNWWPRIWPTKTTTRAGASTAGR